MFSNKLRLFIYTFIISSNTSYANEYPNESADENSIDGYGTTFFSGPGIRNQTVTYAKVNGYAVISGDIIIGTVEEAESWYSAGQFIAKNLIIEDEDFRWPDDTIPYEIDTNITVELENKISTAIAHWEENIPGLIFVERNASNTEQFVDYVSFTRVDSGCSANVGRRGGRQTVNLSDNCTTGNTIHEIGHTLGLWHTHQRSDAIDNIQIVRANMNVDYVDDGTADNDNRFQNNFAPRSGGIDLGPYDYGSIMHYRETAFAATDADGNRLQTIFPLNPLPPGIEMGQRDGLSDGDIKNIKDTYPINWDRINYVDNGVENCISETYGNSDLEDAIDIVGASCNNNNLEIEKIDDFLNFPNLAYLEVAGQDVRFVSKLLELDNLVWVNLLENDYILCEDQKQLQEKVQGNDEFLAFFPSEKCFSAAQQIIITTMILSN